MSLLFIYLPTSDFVMLCLFIVSHFLPPLLSRLTFHCSTTGFSSLILSFSPCSPVIVACVLVLLTGLAVLGIIACKFQKRKGTVGIFISNLEISKMILVAELNVIRILDSD